MKKRPAKPTRAERAAIRREIARPLGVDRRKNTSAIEALGVAWEAYATAIKLPMDYDGRATRKTLAAIERAEGALREHILATGDLRAFSLMHLLGQATITHERELYPQEVAAKMRAIDEAIRAANRPGARTYTAEQVRASVLGKRRRRRRTW